MILRMFSVHDQKAEVFLPPFFVPTKGIATRAFADCINSETHQFGKHPADYTLFYMGDFDDNTGQYDQGVKQSIGNGVEYIDPEHEDSLGDFRNVPQQRSIQSDENG